MSQVKDLLDNPRFSRDCEYCKDCICGHAQCKHRAAPGFEHRCNDCPCSMFVEEPCPSE